METEKDLKGADPSGKHTGPPTITVTVTAPRDPDNPRSFAWPKTMKVEDAAAEAAAAFGYEPGTHTFTNTDGDALDRNKPLVTAGVEDGDELDLVDVGGGV